MKRKPPLIAIVDDDESVRKAVQRLLRSAGMDAETFSSGTKFLDAIRTRSVDCVVLDQHMPGMDGSEVHARLVQSGKWLPIIIMTGRDAPNLCARTLAGGAATYLHKPIDGQVLLDAIATAIASNIRG